MNDAWPVPGRTNASTPLPVASVLGVQVEAASYTRLFFDLPAADKQVQHVPPVVAAGASP